MILALSVRFAGGIHRYLDTYALSNILIRYLQSPGGRKRAFAIAAALAAGYLALTAGLTAIIESGGSGWLNLVVLVCAWNTIKLAMFVCGHVLGRFLTGVVTWSKERPMNGLNRGQSRDTTQAHGSHGSYRSHGPATGAVAENVSPAPYDLMS